MWGALACLCVSGQGDLPLPFCSVWLTDAPEPERRILSVPLYPPFCSRWISAKSPYSTLLSLTLSSCLSRSLCCLCSTFLCMSTRLRIVLSLSIADTGSVACSLSISVDSLSAGLQSNFTTGNSRLVALTKKWIMWKWSAQTISTGCTNT